MPKANSQAIVEHLRPANSCWALCHLHSKYPWECVNLASAHVGKFELWVNYWSETSLFILSSSMGPSTGSRSRHWSRSVWSMLLHTLLGVTRHWSSCIARCRWRTWSMLTLTRYHYSSMQLAYHRNSSSAEECLNTLQHEWSQTERHCVIKACQIANMEVEHESPGLYKGVAKAPADHLDTWHRCWLRSHSSWLQCRDIGSSCQRFRQRIQKPKDINNAPCAWFPNTKAFKLVTQLRIWWYRVKAHPTIFRSAFHNY